MPLVLDRMEIEDYGGASPKRLAAAIHQQLGAVAGAIPVTDIAFALDIVEIREEPLVHFEGALVTTAERASGSILVNRNSNRQRRRYSVGHELLHFLNPLHRQTVDGHFECDRSDMALGGSPSRANLTQHQLQEIQANRFSIELLAPETRMRRHLGGFPDLAHVLAAAGDLDISKEAAARRYAELRGEPLAVMFGKGNVVRYPVWNEAFPILLLASGADFPRGHMRNEASEAVSTMDEVDPSLWLKWPAKHRLYTQTHFQADGHSMTLLLAELVSDDPEAER